METLIYFGKVNICWVLFFSCYWVFFRKHTFFHGNRFYLLVTLLLSFVIPTISFPETEVPALPQVTYIMASTPEIIITAQPVHDTSFPWMLCLLTVYLAGATFMVYRFLSSISKLRRIIVGNEKYGFDDYTLVLLPKTQSFSGSFSFFKWLIVSHHDYNQNLDTILRHESVHIRQFHSVDIILIELLKIACWFNPALWLYKKSLQEIHEYLADEQAPNREQYATFLVSYGLHAPVKSLTNHFFNRSLLKARIQMIYKNRTSRWLLGKYLMIIPVLLLVASLTAARRHMLAPDATDPKAAYVDKTNHTSQESDDFTSRRNTAAEVAKTTNIKGKIVNRDGSPVHNASIVVKNSKMGTSSNQDGNFELNNVPTDSKIVVSHISYQLAEFDVKKSQTNYSITLLPKENLYEEVVVVTYPHNTDNQTGTGEVNKTESTGQDYVIVEKNAEFPGGVHEMMLFLARNIKYPTRASRADVSGNVIISFVVNEYGAIQKTEVVKGLGHGLDEEASRVVWSMPKWNPAIQNGQAVTSQHTIPIKFEIESPSPEKDKRQGFMNYHKVDGINIPDQIKWKSLKFGSSDSLKNQKVKNEGVHALYHLR